MPTLAYIRRAARQRPKDDFASWWDISAPDIYKKLGLKALLNSPKELLLPRTYLHFLIAARSGHGDFAEYHQRFHPENPTTILLCSCGRQKSPTHIFYCRSILPKKRVILGPRPLETIHWILGPDFELFTKLIKATGRLL